MTAETDLLTKGPPGIQGEQGPPGSDGMDANESRVAILEAELASKDAIIGILLGNISELERKLEVEITMAEFSMLLIQIQNQVKWMNETVDWSYMDLSNVQLNGVSLVDANLRFSFRSAELVNSI